jgi:hypothetical protein
MTILAYGHARDVRQSFPDEFTGNLGVRDIFSVAKQTKSLRFMSFDSANRGAQGFAADYRLVMAGRYPRLLLHDQGEWDAVEDWGFDRRDGGYGINPGFDSIRRLGN